MTINGNSLLDLSSGASLMHNVRAGVKAFQGGETPDYMLAGGGTSASTDGSSGSGPGRPELLAELEKLRDQIDSIISLLGGEDSGSPGAPPPPGDGDGDSDMDPISGSGRIWGDPHFIGQDGGKYDVQGEAGKTYNLLSDKDFQMNGRFDQWGDDDGATVVGEVGITTGADDQIKVSKDGSVVVNGRELQEGDTVELQDGGSVSYEDGHVAIDSGEWQTEIEFSGSGDKAHLNIDVSTENAVSDGVKPHGLLGQSFDADDDARNGDEGKGAQGGGAIEGSNGNITNEGDKDAVELYEVDGLYSHNSTRFNQFFDEAEATAQSDPAAYDDQVVAMLSEASVALSQSLLMITQMYQDDISRDAVA